MKSNSAIISPLPPTVAVGVPASEITPTQLVNTLFDQRMVKVAGGIGLHQFNAFAETAKVYGNGRGIHSGVVLGNTAAFDPREYPSGYAINFNVDAAVDTITLSPDAFQYMVLCKIIPGKGQTLTDQHFKDRLGKLDEAAPQFSPTPINGALRTETNFDDDHWEAEMGKGGAFGVLRCRRGPRAHDYYIYARAGAEVLGQDTIKHVADAKTAGKPLTWDQFMRSKELGYWRSAAKRNACRLAHAVSEKLDAAIETVDEDATYTMDDNQAVRVTALPTHQQYVSSLAFSDIRGNRVATQFNQCSPATVSATVRDKFHFVSVSPFQGLVGVRLPGGYSPALGALPTTTGRAMDASEVVKRAVDADDVDAIASQYTWEGKPQIASGGRSLDAKSINDRLHPEAYREFDDAFLETNFVAQGWKKESGVEPFDAVIMKVAARKARPQ